jgi:hypothetical protein
MPKITKNRQKPSEFKGFSHFDHFSTSATSPKRSLNYAPGGGALRVPLQRLFHLPGGEFKGIFLADWSEQCRAVLNLILLDWFGLHEPFYGPGQCF